VRALCYLEIAIRRKHPDMLRLRIVTNVWVDRAPAKKKVAIAAGETAALNSLHVLTPVIVFVLLFSKRIAGQSAQGLRFTGAVFQDKEMHSS